MGVWQSEIFCTENTEKKTRKWIREKGKGRNREIFENFRQTVLLLGLREPAGIV